MIVIIVFDFWATLFAFFSQKRKVSCLKRCNNMIVSEYEQFSYPCFVISFLLHAIPCFACGVGSDIQEYVLLYNSWELSDVVGTKFEPGYILINILLRTVFNNAYVGIGIIKVISIFLVYKAIYMLRKQINIGIAVLSYDILLYIFSFHLLRMSFAIGLIFLGFAYELRDKSKSALFLMLLAFFFHYTSAIVIVAFCFYKLLGKKVSFSKLIVLSFALVILYGNMMPILDKLVSNVDAFSRFYVYLDNANSYIGVTQVILFVPVFYLLYFLYKRGQKDKFYILNAVLLIMQFFTGLLGYLLPVISRTSYYFGFGAMMIFSITPLVKDKYIIVLSKIRVNFSLVVSLIYLMMQIVLMYILNNSFVTNGLIQYQVWWNM